jgi:hypothetical protein
MANNWVATCHRANGKVKDLGVGGKLSRRLSGEHPDEKLDPSKGNDQYK